MHQDEKTSRNYTNIRQKASPRKYRQLLKPLKEPCCINSLCANAIISDLINAS